MHEAAKVTGKIELNPLEVAATARELSSVGYNRPSPTVDTFLSAVRSGPLVFVTWLFAFFLFFQFASSDISYLLAHGRWQSGEGTLVGRDFVNVFTAAHLTLNRSLAAIYDVAAYRHFQLELFDHRVLMHNYSYTPVSFFYVWPFGFTPYVVSYLLWISLTGAAFAFAARPYLREAELPMIVALVTPAAAMNVWAGHYGFLFGALWLGAWSLLDTRPRLAGVLVGFMIVKPHLAILMPLLLAARGSWRAFSAAAATVGILVLASGLVFGWDLWRSYLIDTLSFQASMVDHTEGFFLRMMPTVYPVLRLAGLLPAIAWLFQTLFAIVAIGAMLRWMPRDTKRAGLAAATATFLVLPYAFNYDMTVLGVAAAILLHRPSGDASLQRVWSALVLILPAAVFYANHLGLPVAPALLLAMLGGLLTRRSGERQLA